MKNIQTIRLVLAVLALLAITACSRQAKPDTVRIDFKGTTGVKVEGYSITTGPAGPTTSQINTVVPSSILSLASDIQLLKVRKTSPGTLLILVSGKGKILFQREVTNNTEEITFEGK